MPTIDGHEITVTHPDKVLFPADGITKGELAEYYQQIAPRMIPHVRDRPLHMNRFPGGIQYNPIQQKRVPDSFPAWIKRATVDLNRGGTITHAVIDNTAALVYLAQYNVVTVHVWLSCIQAPNQPDQLMFDLDPADEDFSLVRKTALTLKALLEELKLVPFVKTTGSRGLHVIAPIAVGPTFEEVHRFADALAQQLAADDPKHLTTEFMRNGLHIVGAGLPSHYTLEEHDSMAARYFSLVQKGEIVVSDLVTHRFNPLDARAAYMKLASPTHDALGVLFDWALCDPRT